MSTTMPADPATTLRTHINNLTAADRTFAESLLTQLGQRGLSGKQVEWLNVLADRAASPPPKPVDLGDDVLGIIELLDKAAEHLKRPKIAVRAGELNLRLARANGQSRAPGSVFVTSDAASYEDRTYYGRITRAGRFEASPARQQAEIVPIVKALRALATDPEAAARNYGKLTGHCCFCSLPLSDGRSTAVGYGRKCASNFGLEWGSV
jgi:Family of unknown function (DUF6011)